MRLQTLKHPLLIASISASFHRWILRSPVSVNSLIEIWLQSNDLSFNSVILGPSGLPPPPPPPLMDDVRGLRLQLFLVSTLLYSITFRVYAVNVLMNVRSHVLIMLQISVNRFWRSLVWQAVVFCGSLPTSAQMHDHDGEGGGGGWGGGHGAVLMYRVLY